MQITPPIQRDAGAEKEQRPTIRVLVVDDSAAVRSLLQVYLSLGKRKVELFEAADGARGLQMARLMPFDLVLLDVLMPDLDGFTVLAELRKDARPAVRDVPVVLLTGVEEEGILERALAAGANNLLHKPVSAKALAEALDSILPNHQPSPATQKRSV